MIFFDIDDTLIDNQTAESAAATEFHRNHANIFPVSTDEFVNNWRTITQKYLQRYLTGELSFQDQRRKRLRELFAHHRTLTDAEADILFEGFIESYERNWTLFSDVASCLDQLSGNRLGIISNGNSFQQRQKLISTGIIDRFSVIAISDDFGISKPDPKIFLEACRMAKVNQFECWHIGDNINADVQGSLSAGLNGVWLNRNSMNFYKEFLAIGSLSELKEIIGVHNKPVERDREKLCII